MALSVPPTARDRARVARSMSSDRRTGRRLLTAYVLARTSLLVLGGRVSVDTAYEGHGRYRAVHGYAVGSRLDVVLTGSTDGLTGQRCLLVVGQDDDLAASTAARKAATRAEKCTVAQGAVDRGRASDRPASTTVLPHRGSTAVRDHRGSSDSPRQAEQGRLPAVRPAGPTAAAAQTMSSTLVVAGLIGLLGVSGAAAFIVHSVTGPVRRAARVLQAPVKGRRDHRLRPTSRRDLHDVSRAVGTAGEDPLGAAGGIGADVGPTRPVTRRQDSSPETRNAGTPIGTLVEQARLVALDATIESARSGISGTGISGTGISGTGVAVTAPRAQEPAQEAARAAAAVTPASTPAPGSVATTRYAAARSRAFGPTTALWHAVELDRLVGRIGGACETTVCGSLVRVDTEQRWPVPARDVCPACSTLAH